MYVTGIINSANPSADFYAMVAETLTSVGYVLVDTRTFTGPDSFGVVGTRTHKVWRSPSSTIFGEAWYLDVVYATTGNAPLWFVCFEEYDAATHLAKRGPIMWHADLLQADDSSGGDTAYALEDPHWMSPGHPDDNWYTDESYTLPMLLNNDMGYWGSITADRVIFMVSHQAWSFSYAGFFKPSPVLERLAGANLYPLCMGRVGVYEYWEDYLAVTRHPVNTEADMDIMAVMAKSKEYEQVIPGRFTGLPTLATEMWICSFGGWFGTLYGVAAVSVSADLNGDADAWTDWTGVGRGDTVWTNQEAGSSTPDGEWVLGAPRWANGNATFSMMMKKE